MSKGNRNSTQLQFSRRPGVQTREKPPIPFPTKAGIELRCPFCDDHHLLMPNVESPCGTKIKVMAVQEVISARMARTQELICVKCHQGGGEFVKYCNSYVHLADCTPGTRLLQEVPKFNPLAGLVFKMPAKTRGPIERITGRADQVLEIDNLGHKTGKVLGYFFYQKVSNAQPKPVRA